MITKISEQKEQRWNKMFKKLHNEKLRNWNSLSMCNTIIIMEAKFWHKLDSKTDEKAKNHLMKNLQEKTFFRRRFICKCNINMDLEARSWLLDLKICSWVKRDQLDAPCFIITLFSAQHVSVVNTSILRSLRLMCWVTSWVALIWFDVCWCYVAVWLWWCGIRMQAEALVPPYAGWGTSASVCIRIPHHHSHTAT